MNSNEMGSQTDSLMLGKLVWSVQMHPIYEAVAEVRQMADGRYQIWHHYGEGSIPWANDVSEPTSYREQAIETVRGYQRAFASNPGQTAAARSASLNQASSMHISLN